MLDDASNDRLPSERTFNEVRFLDSEEYSINRVEDYCDKYHDHYYLEMFRHALKEGDQRAQRWLQQNFSAMLLDWIHGHPRSDLACRLHTEEYYIVETFRSFWHTLLKRQKFDLTSMADVLSYLRVSMNGVILDTLRSYARPQEAPLTSTSMAREVQSNENDNSHEIWGVGEGQLANARERRLAYLLFHSALKPGEIVGSFPNEFSDVYEISHLRRNIMELLSRGDQIYLAMNKIS
jgi:hypothetical protein